MYFKRLVASLTLIAFIFTSIPADFALLRPLGFVGQAWAARTPSELTGVCSDRAGSSGSSSEAEGISSSAKEDVLKELNVATFAFPEYLGSVKEKWSIKSTETRNTKHETRTTVIHVQDAHCNYYAQKRIAEIVQYLNKEYGVNTVNLEGGAKEYDLSPFTDIKDLNLRNKASDHFVKEGLVNGAEYFAINNPDKVTLWGIEDTKLYIDNLKIYRNSLKHKDEVDKGLNTLTRILNDLKAKIYSKELLELDNKYTQYKADKLEFKEYLAYLIQARHCEEAEGRRPVLRSPTRAFQFEGEGGSNLTINAFPNIYLLSQTLEEEKAIDFKKANNQRDDLIDKLSKKLSRNSLGELVAKTVEFKSEKISQKDFYEYISDKAKDKSVDLNEFPELKNYIEYISKYDAIDKTKTMEELEQLENATREALFKNDDQRQLDKLSRNLAILKNLFNFTLTRDDYKYYKANEGLFDMVNYARFIASESRRHPERSPKGEAKDLNIDSSALSGPQNDESIDVLDQYRKEIEKFYEFSFTRDTAFLKNIKFTKDDKRKTINEGRATILITGGFHSENLAELFKRNNIAYISIMPNFKNGNGYDCPYFKVLSGEKYIDIRQALPSVLKSALAAPDPLNAEVYSAARATDMLESVSIIAMPAPIAISQTQEPESVVQPVSAQPVLTPKLPAIRASTNIAVGLVTFALAAIIIGISAFIFGADISFASQLIGTPYNRMLIIGSLASGYAVLAGGLVALQGVRADSLPFQGPSGRVTSPKDPFRKIWKDYGPLYAIPVWLHERAHWFDKIFGTNEIIPYAVNLIAAPIGAIIGLSAFLIIKVFNALSNLIGRPKVDKISVSTNNATKAGAIERRAFLKGISAIGILKFLKGCNVPVPQNVPLDETTPEDNMPPQEPKIEYSRGIPMLDENSTPIPNLYKVDKVDKELVRPGDTKKPRCMYERNGAIILIYDNYAEPEQQLQPTELRIVTGVIDNFPMNIIEPVKEIKVREWTATDLNAAAKGGDGVVILLTENPKGAGEARIIWGQSELRHISKSTIERITSAKLLFRTGAGLASIVAHEIGHVLHSYLITQKSVESDIFDELHENSGDDSLNYINSYSVAETDDPYGKTSLREDFATVFEASATNTSNLWNEVLRRAKDDNPHTIPLEKTLFMSQFFIEDEGRQLRASRIDPYNSMLKIDPWEIQLGADNLIVGPITFGLDVKNNIKKVWPVVDIGPKEGEVLPEGGVRLYGNDTYNDARYNILINSTKDPGFLTFEGRGTFRYCISTKYDLSGADIKDVSDSEWRTYSVFLSSNDVRVFIQLFKNNYMDIRNVSFSPNTNDPHEFTSSINAFSFIDNISPSAPAPGSATPAALFGKGKLAVLGIAPLAEELCRVAAYGLGGSVGLNIFNAIFVPLHYLLNRKAYKAEYEAIHGRAPPLYRVLIDTMILPLATVLISIAALAITNDTQTFFQINYLGHFIINGIWQIQKDRDLAKPLYERFMTMQPSSAVRNKVGEFSTQDIAKALKDLNIPEFKGKQAREKAAKEIHDMIRQKGSITVKDLREKLGLSRKLDSKLAENFHISTGNLKRRVLTSPKKIFIIAALLMVVAGFFAIPYLRVEYAYRSLVEYRQKIDKEGPPISERTIKRDAKYYATEFHGAHIDVVAGAHRSPKMTDELLKISKKIISNPNEWVFVVEGLPNRRKLGAHMNLNPELAISNKLSLRFDIPVEDIIPSEGDSEVLDILRKSTGLPKEEIMAATIFPRFCDHCQSAAEMMLANGAGSAKEPSFRAIFSPFLQTSPILFNMNEKETEQLFCKTALRISRSKEELKKFHATTIMVREEMKKARNEVAMHRMEALISKYPGKRFLVVIGANHLEAVGLNSESFREDVAPVQLDDIEWLGQYLFDNLSPGSGSSFLQKKTDVSVTPAALFGKGKLAVLGISPLAEELCRTAAYGLGQGIGLAIFNAIFVPLHYLLNRKAYKAEYEAIHGRAPPLYRVLIDTMMLPLATVLISMAALTITNDTQTFFQINYLGHFIINGVWQMQKDRDLAKPLYERSMTLMPASTDKIGEEDEDAKEEAADEKLEALKEQSVVVREEPPLLSIQNPFSKRRGYIQIVPLTEDSEIAKRQNRLAELDARFGRIWAPLRGYNMLNDIQMEILKRVEDDIIGYDWSDDILNMSSSGFASLVGELLSSPENYKTTMKILDAMDNDAQAVLRALDMGRPDNMEDTLVLSNGSRIMPFSVSAFWDSDKFGLREKLWFSFLLETGRARDGGAYYLVRDLAKFSNEERARIRQALTSAYDDKVSCVQWYLLHCIPQAKEVVLYHGSGNIGHFKAPIMSITDPTYFSFEREFCEDWVSGGGEVLKVRMPLDNIEDLNYSPAVIEAVVSSGECPMEVVRTYGKQLPPFSGGTGFGPIAQRYLSGDITLDEAREIIAAEKLPYAADGMVGFIDAVRAEIGESKDEALLTKLTAAEAAALQPKTEQPISTPGVETAHTLEDGGILRGLGDIMQILQCEGRESAFSCFEYADGAMGSFTFNIGNISNVDIRMGKPGNRPVSGAILVHSHPFLLIKYTMPSGHVKRYAEASILPSGEEFDDMCRISPAKIIGLVWGNEMGGFYLTAVEVDKAKDYRVLIDPYEGIASSMSNDCDKAIQMLASRNAVKFYKLIPDGIIGGTFAKGAIIPAVKEISPEQAMDARMLIGIVHKWTTDNNMKILAKIKHRIFQQYRRKSISEIYAAIGEVSSRLKAIKSPADNYLLPVFHKVVDILWELECLRMERKGLQRALRSAKIHKILTYPKRIFTGHSGKIPQEALPIKTQPNILADLIPLAEAAKTDSDRMRLVESMKGILASKIGSDAKNGPNAIRAILDAIDGLKRDSSASPSARPQNDEAVELEMALRTAVALEGLEEVSPAGMNVVVQIAPTGQRNAAESNCRIIEDKLLRHYNGVMAKSIIGEGIGPGNTRALADMISRARTAMDKSPVPKDARTIFLIPESYKTAFVTVKEAGGYDESRMKVQYISTEDNTIDKHPDLVVNFEFGIELLEYDRQTETSRVPSQRLLNMVSVMVADDRDPETILKELLFKGVFVMRKIDWRTFEEQRQSWEAVATAA